MLIKNAIDKIEVDMENKIEENSSIRDCFLRSFRIVERNVRVEDKKISTLF